MAAQVQYGVFPRLRRLTALLFLILAWVSASAAGANEAGLTWLPAQQQPGGAIAAVPDETTSHQATFEALRTLHALSLGGGDPASSARKYLVDDGTPGFPYLPRRMVASHLAGQPVSGLVNGLRTYQNPDGGFAAWPGEQSTVLDTVEALEAMAAVGSRERTVVQPALQYLVARQRADGGFAHNTSSSASIALTARAIGVFQQHLFDYNLAVPQQAAATFLWQRQTATGWGETWESAHALLSLIPITTDATRYADAVAALRDRQEPNGSWGGSVYATALMLRVLYLAGHRELPPDPSSGILTGRLQDSGTGLPLAGVLVALPGVDAETYSRADGRFELTGLEAGEYLIEYSHAGYALVTQQLRVEAGRRLDVGAVAMQPLVNFGLLQGRVTDGVAGSPISGAVVEVNGSATTTAGDGGFQLVLSPGPIAISVYAAGYVPVSATGTMVAGTTLQFSPALLPEGTEPDPVLTLRGIVLDGTDGTPITGAQITSPSVAGALTGLDGVFRLEGLVPGSLAVTVQAAGYQGVQISILAAQGGELDLGALRLARVEKPVVSSLRGVVQAADGGTPIAGAAVTVGGRTTESDAAGWYTVEGIDALSFTLSVSAPGYFSRQYSVQLAEHGSAEMNVALHKVAVDGIRLRSVASQQPSYRAYESTQFTAVVENISNAGRGVFLAASVLGVSNDFQEDFMVPVSEFTRDTVFMLEPEQVSAQRFAWSTRNLSPGDYKMVARVLDAETWSLLSEDVTSITILETARIDLLEVQPTPSKFVAGQSAEVNIVANLRNGSNVDVPLSFQLTLTAPNGAVIYSDQIHLAASSPLDTITVAVMNHAFDQSGTYLIAIDNLAGAPVGTVRSGRIDVAPNIRIEGQLHIEPQKILPGDNRDVRIRLRIDGVEGMQ